MVTWPSGKAKVCKTFIHQFKSGRHLHKTVMKKMSQSFFFVVASKISDFANQFWTRFYSVVQPLPNRVHRYCANTFVRTILIYQNAAMTSCLQIRKGKS